MKYGEEIEVVLEKKEPPLINKPCRILFLEDNPDDVELMLHELNRAGMTTESTRVDKKARFIQEVQNFRPDVILADYSLPAFNGVQAFQMLNAEKISVPFILVTGVLSEKMALECLNDGIDDFVLKSGFQRLPHAISNAIKKSEVEEEKKRMASELAKSHKELSLLLNRQQMSIEEERMKIARDLHDELGQVLTALKIDVMMLRKKFTTGVMPSQEIITHEFEAIVQTVNQITASVKTISSGLRPETLDELGFLEAIRWQVTEFERRSKIKCKTSLPSNHLEIDKDLSIALFRIVQETLTNVARHSEATQVEIQFGIKAKNIFLEIKDNGKGIAETEVNSSRSLGVIGLRERVRIFNGEFSIGRLPEGGTRVSILIPKI